MQPIGTWWRTEGGGRELLKLALPLILSNSFWTLQITIDSIFLAWLSGDAVSAGFVTSLVFWTPLSLFWATAAYSSTFVAQYVGAGRPRRVGPAVWQALHFSILAGLAFLVMVPLAGPGCALVDPPPPVPGLAGIFL